MKDWVTTAAFQTGLGNCRPPTLVNDWTECSVNLASDFGASVKSEQHLQNVQQAVEHDSMSVLCDQTYAATRVNGLKWRTDVVLGRNDGLYLQIGLQSTLTPAKDLVLARALLPYPDEFMSKKTADAFYLILSNGPQATTGITFCEHTRTERKEGDVKALKENGGSDYPPWRLACTCTDIEKSGVADLVTQSTNSFALQAINTTCSWTWTVVNGRSIRCALPVLSAPRPSRVVHDSTERASVSCKTTARQCQSRSSRGLLQEMEDHRRRSLNANISTVSGSLAATCDRRAEKECCGFQESPPPAQMFITDDGEIRVASCAVLCVINVFLPRNTCFVYCDLGE